MYMVLRLAPLGSICCHCEAGATALICHHCSFYLVAWIQKFKTVFYACGLSTSSDETAKLNRASELHLSKHHEAAS